MVRKRDTQRKSWEAKIPVGTTKHERDSAGQGINRIDPGATGGCTKVSSDLYLDGTEEWDWQERDPVGNSESLEAG
jgi:hypothetical protein